MNSSLGIAYGALGLMAVAPIYWGSYGTLKDDEGEKGPGGEPKKEKEKEFGFFLYKKRREGRGHREGRGRRDRKGTR